MPFKVQVGPPQIAIHQGQTVLVSEQDGQVQWPTERGLYFRDTRLISAWAIFASGKPWVLLNGGPIASYASRIFLTNDEFLTQNGKVAPRTLSLVISREIDGGMHEDLDITNHGSSSVHFSLEITIRCDFADTFEVKSGTIVHRGQISTHWDPDAQTLSKHVVRLGDTHPVGRACRVQPICLPARRRLATRQWHYRAWLEALRLPRGGGTDRARHQRRGRLFPRQPAARAVCRDIVLRKMGCPEPAVRFTGS